jgi:hypothetical protein
MKPLPIPAEKPTATAQAPSSGKGLKITVACAMLVAAGAIYWITSGSEQQAPITLPDATNNNTPPKPVSAPKAAGGKYWVEDPKNPVTPPK